MYQRILLAVDGSDHSLRAAKETVKIATLATNCLIDVVFVADYSKSKNEVLHSGGKGELELSRRMKLQHVESMLKEASLTYQVTILHGEPAPTIVDYANKGKFDLTVLGSRGLNSLQEMVLGSVSHKVVKRVNCPVLITK